MYEPHKDNFERVARESKLLTDIELRCQMAIREILAEAKLDARITFYPKAVRKPELVNNQYSAAVPQEDLDWDKLRKEVNTRFSRVLAYLARS